LEAREGEEGAGK